MKIKLAVFIMVLFIIQIDNAYSDSSSWETVGTYAGTSLLLQGTTMPNMVANLYISFPKNQKCQPETGILLSNDKDPGGFVSRQVTRNIMYIKVNDRTIQSNMILTEYENSFDFGIFCNEEQIEIFNSGKIVTVKFSDKVKPLEFTLNNARQAISKARESCIKR